VIRSVVVDASALLPAWLPQERLQGHTDALIEAHAAGQIRLCAPTLLAYEILNALYLAVRGKSGAPARLDLQAAEEGWRLFTELQISLTDITHIGPRILQLSVDHQRPSAYDMSYVALAEQLQTNLITADERLLHAVGVHLSFVRPLWEHPAV
jgi:predicted nucleic acid-binding protein